MIFPYLLRHILKDKIVKIYKCKNKQYLKCDRHNTTSDIRRTILYLPLICDVCKMLAKMHGSTLNLPGLDIASGLIRASHFYASYFQTVVLTQWVMKGCCIIKSKTIYCSISIEFCNVISTLKCSWGRAPHDHLVLSDTVYFDVTMGNKQAILNALISVLTTNIVKSRDLF